MRKITCILGMVFMMLFFATGHDAADQPGMKLHKSFCGGPGDGFLEKSPLAAGGSQPETGAVIDIDGNVYKTVKIGDQWWMAENLRVTKNRKGHPIRSYCYNDDESYCEKYGRLYTWEVAMEDAAEETDWDPDIDDSPENENRGIAPEGWHIPTEADWDNLVKTLGGEKKVAEMIRVGGPTGFDAHLSGGADLMGKYLYLNKYAMFWSSTAPDEDRAYHMGISSEGKWEKFPAYKEARIHIRCIKDKD
jgi:uncharacterized protein (TIGR02145 family)